MDERVVFLIKLQDAMRAGGIYGVSKPFAKKHPVFFYLLTIFA